MKIFNFLVHPKTSLILIFFLFCFSGLAESKYNTSVPSMKTEKWWGGMVALGSKMPLKEQTRLYNLYSENLNNQNVPLLLSSTGRFVWSENPFSFKMQDGTLNLSSKYEELKVISGGKTLRDAYLSASKTFFAPSGTLPDSLFFLMPQYNTWIELMYNQNQNDILSYANNIIKNNLPVGVFMIDDNWQKYYGNFDFKPDRFSNPKAMVEELHKKGFRIMLWVCPFVSPDSPEFRDLEKKGYLIKKKGTNRAAIIRWWNGYSASYDLSNPDAMLYLKNQLITLKEEYGIDGFKFDAGDIIHYDNPNLSFYDKTANAANMSEYWAKLGLAFPFNEYRACWKMGGQALVQRLGDKNYSWEALSLLIPDMLNAGLLGYAYSCPDMIGGGQFTAFLNIDQNHIDQELIVRSCQVHTLMPMMQFSVAPWRILSEENLAIVRDMAHLHKKFGSYILSCARESAKSGEPIIRHMEYAFPGEGFAECKDQFMLGEEYMVAPIVTNKHKRSIKIPKGKWEDDLGKIHTGGKIITIDVPLNRLVYFKKSR